MITSFSCAHGQTLGLESCDDSTGSHTKTGGHGRLDTSTRGVHTYTVTLTTKGGTTKKATVSYRVVGPLATSISTSVATVSHHRARIALSCSGGLPGAKCRGILKLRIRRLVAGRVRMVGIGRAPYVRSTGGSRPVVVRLTRLGMSALRHAAGRHRGVRVIAVRSAGPPVARTIRLQLS